MHSIVLGGRRGGCPQSISSKLHIFPPNGSLACALPLFRVCQVSALRARARLFCVVFVVCVCVCERASLRLRNGNIFLSCLRVCARALCECVCLCANMWVSSSSPGICVRICVHADICKTLLCGKYSRPNNKYFAGSGLQRLECNKNSLSHPGILSMARARGFLAQVVFPECVSRLIFRYAVSSFQAHM